MSCEYAKAGERVTLTGSFMVNDAGVPLEVYFTGDGGQDVPATINNISDDFTSVEVTIPDGAAEGPVTMTSIYGTAHSSFYYQDHRGMLFDFDNGRTQQGWHARTITSSDMSISGNYLVLGEGATTVTTRSNTGAATGALPRNIPTQKAYVCSISLTSRLPRP